MLGRRFTHWLCVLAAPVMARLAVLHTLLLIDLHLYFSAVAERERRLFCRAKPEGSICLQVSRCKQILPFGFAEQHCKARASQKHQAKPFIVCFRIHEMSTALYTNTKIGLFLDEALSQCCFNDGPALYTVDQY